MTSWNYKDQEPETFRHYGPMAQEFFAAFGHDKYGIIGNDSTIAQSDLEGISVAAIQALIKRTDAQANEIKELRNSHPSVVNQPSTTTSIVALQKKNEELAQEIATLKQQVNALLKITKDLH